MPGIIRSLMERRVSPSNPNRWLVEALGGAETKSGIQIDEATSMKFAAVHACVRVLAESVAVLPLPVYRRLTPRGKERVPNHPLYRLLHDSPNPEITPFHFRETLTSHAVLWGNAYAEIEFDRGGRPIALWPLLPDRTRARRKDGVLEYITRVRSREVLLPAHRVLHVPGLGFDGVRGLSPIALHREAIALGLAAEEMSARFYGDGANPSGMIEFPGTFKDAEDRSDFRKQFQTAYGGLENAQRQIVLEQGMTWKPTQMPPRDAQLITSRTFQIREVARIFRVPPHMIAELEQATFSNIEHQSIDFVTHALTPWLVRWEQAINKRLVPESQKGDIFAEFLSAALLRGDAQARNQAFQIARNGGWMSANDIREFENMNPIEGGDVYLIPLNMVPADQVTNGDGAADDNPPALAEGDSPPRALAEGRSSRSVTGRRRSQRANRRLMKAAATRAIKREVDKVRKAIRDGVELPTFIADFYGDGDYASYIRRQVTPVLLAMGEMISADAADEIGADQDMGPEIDLKVRAYAEGMSKRMTDSSSGQLRRIMAETAPADVAGALETRLDEWVETRPAKIAKRDTVDAGSMIAKAVWAANGISKLVWRTVGDNCPLCDELDGKVVEITQHFVKTGDRVNPADDDTAPLDVTRNLGHPPLHEGCDCTISPG